MMKLNKVIHNGVASYMQYKGSQPVRSMIGYDKSIPFYVQDLSGEANTLKLGAIVSDAEYSLDNVTWSSLDVKDLSFAANSKVYLRAGEGKKKWGTKINCTGNFKIGGNMISLVRGADFVNYDNVPAENYQYMNMFQNSITIIDASELLVPINVSNWGFSGTFAGCTNLISAPNISKITSIAFQGCKSMFSGCTSLVNIAGSLPTITNGSDKLVELFKNCTSLVRAPEIPAVTAGGGVGMNRMFQGCTNLNYIKCLATNVPENGYTDWVDGVASSGTFVKAAGATWPTGVNGIPEGWTVIEV